MVGMTPLGLSKRILDGGAPERHLARMPLAAL